MITNLIIKLNVDKDVKEKAEKILHKYGLNIQETFKLFLKRIVLDGNDIKKGKLSNSKVSDTIATYGTNNLHVSFIDLLIEELNKKVSAKTENLSPEEEKELFRAMQDYRNGRYVEVDMKDRKQIEKILE